MSSSIGEAGAPGVQLDPVSDASPAEPQAADWLERVQRPRPRHAAITRNLQTWSSYKSWADQVSESWESGVVSGEIEAIPLSEVESKK
jgi:hypothetical protein